jgi:putative flippase GtrA/GT2 family glycosyltransferase
LTPGESEDVGGAGSTALETRADEVSQAEGLKVLLSMAVGRAEDFLNEIALREEEALTGPIEAIQDSGTAAALSFVEPIRGAKGRRPRKAAWSASTGRHAVAAPPLRRRGARFMIFSGIGGFVFLLGIALQVVLTGKFHVQPVVSYIIQAIVSVEASFLLNRWLTWRDRNTPFWPAFARFNAQKTVTIILNLLLYAGLLRLGMNYLVANVVLTVVFTIVNFVAGDRLVFVPGRKGILEPGAPAVMAALAQHPVRRISVVIPCRDNERTIGAAVQSLLDQDYPGLEEIILIGSPGDRTWNGLPDVEDRRLTIWETATPPGVRDANFKRDAAIRRTSGDLVALVDSDMVLPPDWLSRAVAAMDDSGASCVTGGMRSIHDGFWGRYTDSTFIGAKTPRITQSYLVTSADFGAHGRKPPITANTLFTRELYDRCPIDPSWSHGSYEDYEWFWRVTRAGYGIFVCQDLFGWHHHRRGLRALAKEYRRSSRGCAYFIRAHRDCPLARRRVRQVFLLPLGAIVIAFVAAAAAISGHTSGVAAVALGSAAVLAVHQVARSRSLESLAYPVAGFALGVVFTAGLAMNLIQSGSALKARPVAASAPFGSEATQPRPSRWRLLYPLFAICAIQTGLSLTLVWSNTAYTDEADCLWIGRLELAHWLHGTSWPSTSAYLHLSGSPLIYPPFGALADSVGGLAGARILSLAFMLIATVLLYLVASRLIGHAGALFAAALWALSEPAMRLAFATYDPLSVLLTALSAWLVVQAGFRNHRGEFIAAAAFVLALSNVTAYSGIIIVPGVIAFAFLAWRDRMRLQQSLSCTAWLTGAWALSFGLLMTVSHSWFGLFSTVLGPNAPGSQAISSTLDQLWGYSGLIIGLAAIGALVTFQSEARNHVAVLGGLCLVAFVITQLHNQNLSSIDEHLAYGIWLAAIPAGFACSRFIRWLPSSREQLAALCCAVALAYPAATAWQSAWERYHAWPNADAFISAFKPVAAESQGLLYVPAHEANIAEYYVPQTNDWTRWSAGLTLDPANVPQDSWVSYYLRQLNTGDYGTIALFYSTTFSSVRLPGSVLLSSDNRTYKELLGLVGNNSGEPGLPALTQALIADGSEYSLISVGPYNTSNLSGSHNYGIYAIWQKRA